MTGEEQEEERNKRGRQREEWTEIQSRGMERDLLRKWNKRGAFSRL